MRKSGFAPTPDLAVTPRLAALSKLIAPALIASALVAPAIVGLCAPSVAAAQTSVIVLGIRSYEGDDEFARNLTGALRHAASQVQGWAVSDREVTLAQMALAHGCDEPSQACMAEIANSLEVERILYGEVRRTSATEDYDFSMNLHLFNGATGEIEHSLAETIPRMQQDIDDLRDPVRRFVAALSGAPRSGSIVVAVNVPGAEVFVDDVSAGTADADGRLVISDVQSGTRHIRVGAEGHNSFRTTISVDAYGEASIEAELQPSGGGGGGGGGVPIELIVGGGLMAVAAVSAGLWIWSMVEVDQINGDPVYVAHRNDMTPMGMDVCVLHGGFGGGAATPTFGDRCSRASTFEALQFVFLGLAAVSGGVGAYFLATGAGGGGDAEAASFRLTPSVGPNHASVGLSGAF